MNSDEFFSLSPASFFQISWDCFYFDGNFSKLSKQKLEKYVLPDTSQLYGEVAFAKIAMGWNREGLDVLALVQKPFHQAVYPEVTHGDSLEIMIDTRDVKTSGYNTRFCHHFFFLPEAIEGHQTGEITRFRTEDTHELCNPGDLKVTYQPLPKSYSMQIFIPRECLYGYDPDQFDRMGFTYRVNRWNGNPQHFSVATEDFQIEQQPSLWSSAKLRKA
jgi:hypothetical protein